MIIIIIIIIIIVVIAARCEDFAKAVERLTLISAYVALVMLKNLLSAQELVQCPHTSLGELCRSRLFEREKIDDQLKSAFCCICNVSLTDDQWLQASLPVRSVGRGISLHVCRRCRHLLPSWLPLRAHRLRLWIWTPPQSCQRQP